jgi:hypothetical protein
VSRRATAGDEEEDDMAQSVALARPLPGRLRTAFASPYVVAGGIFVGALCLRLALAAQMAFPPLGDAAYYISVAQSLYAGRGFTSGIVWNYQPPPRAAVGPSNDYWGPLPSIAEWVGFLLFGNHLFAALVPGAVAGALLVTLTYLCGRAVLADWLRARGTDVPSAERVGNWLALGAALLIAVDAELTYQSVMGDSGMLYGILGFGAIILWERALRPVGRARLPLAAVGAGVLLGCAYLTRGSFIFLVFALAAWWAWRWRRDSRVEGSSSLPRLAVAAGALAAGALVVVAPWLVRQQVIFGHMFSQEVSHNALAFSIEDFSDYGTAPTLATMLHHGLGALLSLRIEALWNDWHHVTDYLFYPTALPAVIGLVLLARRQSTAALGLLNTAVLLFGFALLFPAVTLYGAYYHSVASVAPFLAWGYLAAAYALADWARSRLPLHVSLAPALAAIPILLQAALLALAFPVIVAGSQQDARTFAGTATWLRAHDARVVMTNQSSTLYYASGIPSIELPAGQSPDVALACARRYGAQFLVLYGTAGDYPAILDRRPDGHFVLVHRSADYEVYRINP